MISKIKETWTIKKCVKIFGHLTKENVRIVNKWLIMSSTFLVLKIMQIIIIIRYNFITNRVQINLMIPQRLFIDNTKYWKISWSNWEFSYMVDGNIKWYNAFGKLFVSYKVNCVSILWSRSSTPRQLHKRYEDISSQNDLYKNI